MSTLSNIDFGLNSNLDYETLTNQVFNNMLGRKQSLNALAYLNGVFSGFAMIDEDFVETELNLIKEILIDEDTLRSDLIENIKNLKK